MATDPEILEWLASQPTGCEVHWYSDHLSAENPVADAWVDIYTDDLGWAWTVSTDEEAEDILWPADYCAMRLCGPYLLDIHAVVLWPVDRPAVEMIDEVRTAMAAAPEGQSVFWVGVPAWSAAAVSEAIEMWCRFHGFEVKAVWDSDHAASPWKQSAMEMMQAMEDGTLDKYLLKPGEAEGGDGLTVYASPQVMDVLLQEMLDDEE